MMLKLYKRIDGVLHYHEAWEDDGKIVEHWGKAGLRGKVTEHPAAAKSGTRALKKVLKRALDSGYAPVPARKMAVVMVEYAIKGFGKPADLEKRHKLEDFLNDVLGWSGLGATAMEAASAPVRWKRVVLSSTPRSRNEC